MCGFWSHRGLHSRVFIKLTAFGGTFLTILPIFAIITNSYTIKLWDAQTGAEVMTLRGHRTPVWTLAFNPDGKQIVSGSNDGIKLWDVQTGTEAVTLRGPLDDILSVAFSPDGKRIISGGWHPIKIWDATTGDEMLTLRGHETQVYNVAFSPDGKRIVSSSLDKNIKVWDAETGKELKAFRGHDWSVECVAFTPDGKRLISASWDDTVKLWDVMIDRESIKIHGHRRVARSIAFSPDGRQIVSGSYDYTIKLWNAQTGEAIRTMRVRGLFPSGQALGLTPSGVAFSPDGRRIASGEGDRRFVRVWDASTGAQLMALRGHKDLVRCAAFSPDGKYIVSGSDDKTIKVWDAMSGSEIITFQGHKDMVSSVAFSPDGKKLVSGSWDNTVRVWDLTSRAELMTLRAHRAYVMSVTFSPDGKRIATASVDRTTKIWDAATGIELLALHTDSIIFDVAFSPDGRVIAAGAAGLAGGDLMLWESTAPAGGYEPRRNAEIARKLVEKLYSKSGLYRDVISELQSDVTIDSPVRKVALQIANSLTWEDAVKLTNEAWETVSLPDKDVAAYQVALEKASKANALEPNDPAILNTLGPSQYRLGSYEDALKTLTTSEQILSSAKEEPDPVNIAFTAMTLHKIGRADEAKNALEKLRELCKDEQFAEDIEVQALLAEAEKLFAGEK